MGNPIVAKSKRHDYEKSLSSVIKKIEESKHKAITTVNKLLIDLYWFIGETIVSLQEKSRWGDAVVEKLSSDLKMKYPEHNGFSIQNLWHMKKYCLTYRNTPILQTVSGELSWSNNILILEKTKTTEEKEFYCKMCLLSQNSLNTLVCHSERSEESYFFNEL